MLLHNIDTTPGMMLYAGIRLIGLVNFTWESLLSFKMARLIYHRHFLEAKSASRSPRKCQMLVDAHYQEYIIHWPHLRVIGGHIQLETCRVFRWQQSFRIYLRFSRAICILQRRHDRNMLIILCSVALPLAIPLNVSLSRASLRRQG